MHRQRKALRLEGYNYAQEGAYFLTVCVNHRLCLFGEILADDMRLNPAGDMALYWWGELVNKFPDVELDTAVVMPNHLHGIVVLQRGGQADPTGTSVPEAMHWFKTMTTNAYIRGVKQDGWPRFEGQLWQRSYYDRIIRDEAALNEIRQYVVTNPARWADDEWHSGGDGM